MDTTGFRSDDLYGTADQTYQGTLVHVEDSVEGAIQVNAHADEILQAENCTLVQHYGFSSHPPNNTELVLQPLESGAVASVAENVDRPSLSDGQVRLWDKNDNYVDLKPGDMVKINQENGNSLRFYNNGIKAEVASGKILYLIGQTTTRLGTTIASQPMVLGTTHTTLWATFLGALQTFLGNWKTTLNNDFISSPATYVSNLSGYIDTLTTALSALQGGLTSALSTKHFLDA